MKTTKLFLFISGIIFLVFIASCSKEQVQNNTIADEQSRLEKAIELAESKGYIIDKTYPNLNADSIFYGMKIIESMQFELTEEEKKRYRNTPVDVVGNNTHPRATEAMSWQEKVSIEGSFSSAVISSTAEMRVQIHRQDHNIPDKTKLLEAKVKSSNPSGATFTPDTGIGNEFNFNNKISKVSCTGMGQWKFVKLKHLMEGEIYSNGSANVTGKVVTFKQI